MALSFRFFDWGIAIFLCIVAIGVWFVPSLTDSKKMKELEAASAARRVEIARLKAEEDRRAAQNREEGLVFISPSTERK